MATRMTTAIATQGCAGGSATPWPQGQALRTHTNTRRHCRLCSPLLPSPLLLLSFSSPFLFSLLFIFSPFSLTFSFFLLFPRPFFAFSFGLTVLSRCPCCFSLISVLCPDATVSLHLPADLPPHSPTHCHHPRSSALPPTPPAPPQGIAEGSPFLPPDFFAPRCPWRPTQLRCDGDSAPLLMARRKAVGVVTAHA